MGGWVSDWLELLARWFHLIVGAGWIGTSFYFNFLNNNIRPVEEDDPRGKLAGALWSVHGGAFYKVSKLEGAPNEVPEELHWFKWEAYLTWISGITLLILVYWMQADVMMVPAGSDRSPGAAAGIGVFSLVVGWCFYDVACKLVFRRPRLLLGMIFVFLCLASVILSQLLSPRAAYIHVGAMMGTMMALNVFFIIIPGQKAMVDAALKGEEPDLKQGQAGSLRSLHNNYFTLPVLFVMVSNHFPFTYGKPYGWAILIAISVLGVAARHGANLAGRGTPKNWIYPVTAVGMLALAFVAHGPRKAAPVDPNAKRLTYEDVKPILQERCWACHIAKPTWPGMTEPPKGLEFNKYDVVSANRANIRAQAVDTITMPLGNVTQMTDEERAKLGQWIDAGAPLD